MLDQPHESTHKLTTIESQISASSSQIGKDHLLSIDGGPKSGKVNISKLSENILSSNLSKQSWSNPLIHLSCNSNNFLNPKNLLDQKQGMFGSAELT